MINIARSPRWIMGVIGAMMIALSGASLAEDRIDFASVHLVTGDDYPPYTGIDLPHGGLSNRIVQRALALADVKVDKLHWLPWKRGYESTKQGLFQATFPYGYTPERGEIMLYSDPLHTEQSFAYSHPDAPNIINQPEDISGLTFCSPRGYGDFGVVARLLAEGRITRMTPNTMDQCFAMLDNQRVSIVLGNHNVVEKLMRASGRDPSFYQRSKAPIYHLTLYVISAKNNPEGVALIKAFNKGLRLLKQTGEWTDIHESFKLAINGH